MATATRDAAVRDYGVVPARGYKRSTLLRFGRDLLIVLAVALLLATCVYLAQPAVYTSVGYVSVGPLDTRIFASPECPQRDSK